MAPESMVSSTPEVAASSLSGLIPGLSSLRPSCRRASAGVDPTPWRQSRSIASPDVRLLWLPCCLPLSRLEPSRQEEFEDWPWLDLAVLRSSRSRQVCMSCYWIPPPRRGQLHPFAHLSATSGPDRPWRAPHQPLPGLDGRHAEVTLAGADSCSLPSRCGPITPP